MVFATVFRPPHVISPNNTVVATRNVWRPLTWQRSEHMAQRCQILTRIAQLLTRNAKRVISQQSEVAMTKTWVLARKLEVLMFLRSASLLEYVNLDSLPRRVQALTASIVFKKIRRTSTLARETMQTGAATNDLPKGAMPMCCVPTVLPVAPSPIVMQDPITRTSMTMAPLPASADSDGRQLPRRSQEPSLRAIECVDHTSSRKRMRYVSLSNEEAAMNKHWSSALCTLLFRGYEELSQLVWSYVDGVQIMRARRVCRVACALTPLFVTSLQLSCNAIQKALATQAGGSACILRECIHLQELEIVSLAAGMTFGTLAMRAAHWPQRFVVNHDDHEQIVLSMAAQMRLNTFPGLVRLSITCLCTNGEANGKVDVLLNTLMLGCCPRVEELCLPGNSFGDYGATKVAQLLRAQSCPNLTRLDLRRNFIGEDGIRSLCHALADGCALKLTELCLGGNTITDSSFHHVLYAMESRSLQKLRFLGIEMNYLTATSMTMLGRTVGKLVCPQLAQISYSDNSVENSCAKRLIATAVYHERVWQAKRQQRSCDGLISEDKSTCEQF